MPLLESTIKQLSNHGILWSHPLSTVLVYIRISHFQYLLTSVNDQHCINCKSVIPFDIFLNKFGEKWIFFSKEYKTHRHDVLLEREQSFMAETVNRIELKKVEKKLLIDKKKLLDSINQLKKVIENQFINVQHIVTYG